MASAVNLFTVWNQSRSPEYRGNDIDDQFRSLRKKKGLSEVPVKIDSRSSASDKGAFTTALMVSFNVNVIQERLTDDEYNDALTRILHNDSDWYK